MPVVLFDFKDVTKSGKYPANHQEQTFLSLKDYLKLAQRYTPAILRNDEDAIAFIAERLMMCDWSFSTEYDVPVEARRQMYASWAVRVYLKRMKNKKNKTYQSLDSTLNDDLCMKDLLSNAKSENPQKRIADIELTNQLEFLIKNSGLTDKQEKYIRLYYLEGRSQESIADENGVSRQAIEQSVNDGIAKIQSIVKRCR